MSPVSITQDVYHKPVASTNEDPLLFSNLSLPYYYFNGEEAGVEGGEANSTGQVQRKPVSCLLTVTQEQNSGKNAAQERASWLQEPKRNHGWRIALYLALLLGGIGVLCGGYFLLTMLQKNRM